MKTRTLEITASEGIELVLQGKITLTTAVAFFVPDVFRTREHGLEYSRFATEAATKFFRSLVSSA